MQQVADGLWHIPLTPRNGVNAYLLGDVLVDAGIGMHGKKLAQRLAGRGVTAHAITHAHPDHVGGSKNVLDGLGVPLWVGAGDAAAAQSGQAVVPEGRAKGLRARFSRWPAVPVTRRLTEGDDVAGFTVLDVPGHSPGHIAFWRESDRVLVAGDVWFNLHPFTLRQPDLRQPLKLPTVDPERNRASERKLAALEPDVVCFGHGPPLRDAAPKLKAFVEKLPG